MTSSNLQRELNYFIYNATAEEGLIDLIKKQIPIQKINYSPVMLEERWQPHLPQKELQKINAYRYSQGFKIAKTTSNPSKIYQNIDYTVPALGFTLNTNAFLVSIELLGDQHQAAYWRQQVYSGKVIGAYGQTQLGHGSNVKDLQTVAVYDQRKEKFIMNSPSNTSAKFWPGLLGQYATHAVIQAQTIVKGVNIGIQTFVVQIRNQKLQQLSNVQVFDIGPKLGLQRVDNGALILKNIQLPLNSMLMKYVKVKKDGAVQGLQNKQAIKYGYGSMLNLRVKLTYNFAMVNIIHPTIALHQILNRIGQSSKQKNRKFITEWLCCGYGIIISNRNTHNMLNKFLKEIKGGNFQKADKLLINCHIISSTFKAVSSRIGVDILTELLTFNLYSKFKSSFLPSYFANQIPSTTYEGDNTVLLQQTAKYLLFKFDAHKRYENILKTFNNNDWESISKAIEYIISEKIKIIKGRMENHEQNKIGFKTIWNQKEQVKLVQVSTLWGYMMLLKGLAITLPQIANNRSFYAKICSCFTSYLLQKIPQLQIYGFTIQPVQNWKSFSEQEFDAMININTPIERQMEPMRFYERQSDWIQASL